MCLKLHDLCGYSFLIMFNILPVKSPCFSLRDVDGQKLDIVCETWCNIDTFSVVDVVSICHTTNDGKRVLH